MSLKIVFFAYESKRQENVDAITKAAKDLTKNKKKLKIIRWEDLSVSGKIISSDILDHIKKCDKFACDLTYLNHNVLFELGYAIAQQKRIKIFLNPSIVDAKRNYTELKILKTIGFREFLNAKDISRELQGPTTSDESSLIIEKIIPGHNSIKIENDIFLINLKNKNQAAIDIEEFISAEYSKFITNNEDEIAYQPLVWYINAILKSKIVLLHMLGNDKIDFKVANAEFSLYAGLAYGLGKEVLMVAPKPFNAPIDYSDILIEYESSEDCVDKTLKWIESQLKNKNNNYIQTIQDIKNEQRELNLLKLGIGEGVAEKDSFTSIKTFVEIDAYTEALKRQKVIIIGRKGSGKTEIFMRLKDSLDDDRNTYNIIIKPDSDEMLSNVELSTLYHNDRSKKAFLKTVWEYIILSKIFLQIFNNKEIIKLSEIENKNINICYENDKDMFNYNFYGMILYIARIFHGHDITKDLSLLEKIKEKLLPIKTVIKNFLENRKYQKINILADNLDSGWGTKSDLELQSLIIICLLEYLDELEINLGEKVKTHSVIFLRKDIFNYILRISREPDKMIMDSFEINWVKYPKLLKTVIDKRIESILENTETSDKIWQDYFLIGNNEDPFSRIQSYIVKRPRDVIYFISRLFESAANNNKNQVTNDDFNYAIDEYTKYLYGNLFAELKAEFPLVEDILRELRRVYTGILSQFTFISEDNFYRIVQKYLNKKESEKFIKVLMENDYLGAVIKKNNQVISDYDELISVSRERKFKIFKKNKVLLNMKLVPFAE